MKTRVYVIGFNSQKRISKAFESVPDKYDKILLDNGSIVLKPPDGVESVVTGPGMFTDAFNFALADSIKHNAIPIVCNDDIAFEDGCIEKLVESIEAGAGLACPIQVNMALPDNIIMGGTMQCYPAGIHRTGIRGKHYLESRDYPWLPFCVTAVNPLLLREIGFLDRNLKMWFSDSDYSIRARAAGYTVMLIAGAFIRHEQSAAVKAARSETLNRQFVLDKAFFERKYGGQILEECK